MSDLWANPPYAIEAFVLITDLIIILIWICWASFCGAISDMQLCKCMRNPYTPWSASRSHLAPLLSPLISRSHTHSHTQCLIPLTFLENTSFFTELNTFFHWLFFQTLHCMSAVSCLLPRTANFHSTAFLSYILTVPPLARITFHACVYFFNYSISSPLLLLHLLCRSSPTTQLFCFLRIEGFLLSPTKWLWPKGGPQAIKIEFAKASVTDQRITQLSIWILAPKQTSVLHMQFQICA